MSDPGVTGDVADLTKAGGGAVAGGALTWLFAWLRSERQQERNERAREKAEEARDRRHDELVTVLRGLLEAQGRAAETQLQGMREQAGAHIRTIEAAAKGQGEAFTLAANQSQAAMLVRLEEQGKAIELLRHDLRELARDLRHSTGHERQLFDRGADDRGVPR